MINLYSKVYARLLTLSREKGATAVEYGIMVGLIAVAIIITVGVLGGQLDALFQTVSDALPAAP
ncbi:Flp family type IVb pilin [Flindersiella endophytica]